MVLDQIRLWRQKKTNGMSSENAFSYKFNWSALAAPTSKLAFRHFSRRTTWHTASERQIASAEPRDGEYQWLPLPDQVNPTQKWNSRQDKSQPRQGGMNLRSHVRGKKRGHSRPTDTEVFHMARPTINLQLAETFSQTVRTNKRIQPENVAIPQNENVYIV